MKTTEIMYLPAGGSIMVEREAPVERYRSTLVWTRFHNNPTLFQMPGGRYGSDAKPVEGKPGLALYHRCPVNMIELGVRVVLAMELDPRRQIFRAATKRSRARNAR